MLKPIFAWGSAFLECAAGGLATFMVLVGIAIASDAQEMQDWMGRAFPYIWVALSIAWVPFVVWRRRRKAHA